MHVALITGAEMAKPDPESYLLIQELNALNVKADLISWRAKCDWAQFDLVVIRTPWDYFLHLNEFLAWVKSVEKLTKVLNASDILAWNSHKKYLQELSNVGVPVVPTHWVMEKQNCMGLMKQITWPVVVIKPAVSIGAIGALRGDSQDPQMQAHLNQLVINGDAMIQPFLESVSKEGELSLIYFDGVYSHAVCKKPQQGDYRVQDSYGGTNSICEADEKAKLIGEQVLAYLSKVPLYARVDLVKDQKSWLLMELEAIEPELFLPIAAGAASRFARAICTKLHSSK
jgi:glutathione synthase/RimK-type ligase-like ATP-grasp enzyme